MGKLELVDTRQARVVGGKAGEAGETTIVKLRRVLSEAEDHVDTWKDRHDAEWKRMDRADAARLGLQGPERIEADKAYTDARSERDVAWNTLMQGFAMWRRAGRKMWEFEVAQKDSADARRAKTQPALLAACKAVCEGPADLDGSKRILITSEAWDLCDAAIAATEEVQPISAGPGDAYDEPHDVTLDEFVGDGADGMQEWMKKQSEEVTK